MKEEIKEIQKRVVWTLNRMVQGVYFGWSQESCLNNMREAIMNFNDSMKRENLIDWRNLTVEDCKALGFAAWISDDCINEKMDEIQDLFEKGKIDEGEVVKEAMKANNQRGLYLIPLYLFDQIPEGMSLYDIDGELFCFDREKADKETRWGCLAYGVRAKRIKESC